MDAHPIEKRIGILTYFTSGSGIGGKLRTYFEDFIVEEINFKGEILHSLNKNELNLKNLPANQYTYNLVLEKRNMETFTAIRKLAIFLQIPFRMIGFAGLKDKRAITAQQISISGADLQVLTQFQNKNIKLNRFSPGKLIKLGNLNGNHFQIIVRQIEGSLDQAEQKIKQIKENLPSFYVPNYYGHQRFGVIRPISHKLGRALLSDDFETALKIYLTDVFPQEDKEIQELRAALNESWPTAELTFPKGFFYENKIIEYLKEYNLNFRKTFRRIFPFRFLLLFIHAYQSYLFNHMLSARIKTKLPFDRALDGDYVAILDQYSLPTHVIYEVNPQNITSLNKAIDIGKATIMAPLIGYDFDYSRYPLSDVIAQLLEKEQLDLAHFQSSSNKKLHIKVKYRPLSFKPKGFKVKITQSPVNSDEIAIKFRFSLNKGCYSTILFREFMKASPLYY